MNPIEAIVNRSHQGVVSYPEAFEALKTAGVERYSCELTHRYTSVYEGTFGKWEQNDIEDYQPLKTSEIFCAQMIKEAIMNRAHGKTSFVEFLQDIAQAGVSHYAVDMKTRELKYYNPSEAQYHSEIVPKI
jgi:uncharacterized protein YbcV (DUF1398 family)